MAHSIANPSAWKTAESVHAQGGEIVLTNAPVALRMGTINELGEKVNAPVIPADATSLKDFRKPCRSSYGTFWR